MKRDLLRDAGHHLPDFARLTLDRVAEDRRRVARFARHGRGGFERHLRRGDHARFRAREARIAGFHRFARSRFE